MMYPKIAEISLKNKHINTKIPVRIKIIELTEYECPKCNNSGTITQLAKYCDSSTKFKFPDKFINITQYLSMPDVLYKSRSEIFCPVCYEKGKSIKLKVKITKLYKAYHPIIKFLQVDRIVSSYLCGRWKPSRGMWGYGKVEYYSKDLKEIISNFKQYNKQVEKHKDKNVKVKIFNVTNKELEKAHKESKLLKVVNAL